MFNLFKKKEKKQSMEEVSGVNYIENIYEVKEANKKEKKGDFLKGVKRKGKHLVSFKDLNIFNEEFYEKIKDSIDSDLGYIDLNKAKKVLSIEIEDIDEVIDFSFLKYFININSLYFENCKIKSLEPVGNLEKLELLDLTNYNSSADFDFLKLNNLEKPIELNLFDFQEINFLDFKGCEKIDNLVIDEVGKVNLEGVKEVKGINKLEISDLDIEQIKLLSEGNFKNLDVRLKKNVDANEAYKEISKIKQLEILEINNCSLSDLDFLSNLPLIKDISFYEVKIKDWSNLLKCNNIKTLQLSGFVITEEILTIISKMKNLENIYIRSSDIESLEILKDSKNLKTINLWGSKIKNKNLKRQLGTLKNIVSFDLY